MAHWNFYRPVFILSLGVFVIGLIALLLCAKQMRKKTTETETLKIEYIAKSAQNYPPEDLYFVPVCLDLEGTFSRN